MKDDFFTEVEVMIFYRVSITIISPILMTQPAFGNQRITTYCDMPTPRLSFCIAMCDMIIGENGEHLAFRQYDSTSIRRKISMVVYRDEENGFMIGIERLET